MSKQTPDTATQDFVVPGGAKDLSNPYTLGIAVFNRLMRKHAADSTVGDQGDLNASTAFAVTGALHSASFEEFCDAAREELNAARNEAGEPKYSPEQIETILANGGMLSTAPVAGAPVCTGDECELPDSDSQLLSHPAIPGFRFGFYEYSEAAVHFTAKDSRRRG